MDITVGRGGLVAGREIANVLGEWGLDCDISELERTFLAVATDLRTGREVWLREGALLPAVRASVSLPGLFAPQLIGDRWLMDGGLTNPVPISAARALGADVVIAVNPNSKPPGRVWVPERGEDIWGWHRRTDGRDAPRDVPGRGNRPLSRTSPGRTGPRC